MRKRDGVRGAGTRIYDQDLIETDRGCRVPGMNSPGRTERCEIEPPPSPLDANVIELLTLSGLTDTNGNPIVRIWPPARWARETE